MRMEHYFEMKCGHCDATLSGDIRRNKAGDDVIVVWPHECNPPDDEVLDDEPDPDEDGVPTPDLPEVLSL